MEGWGIPPVPPDLPVTYDPVQAFLDMWDAQVEKFRLFEQAGWNESYSYLRNLGFEYWYARNIKEYSIVIFASRVNPNITARIGADAYIAAFEVWDKIPYYEKFWGVVPSIMEAWFKRVYKLEGYELELKIDEIINHIGILVRIREWIIQDERNRAEHRKSFARAQTLILLAGIGMAFYPAVIHAYTSAQAAAVYAETMGMSTLSTVYLTVKVFITTLAASFKSFLSAIQFGLWMSVHRIAYMVSEDYRVMIGNVYSEISRVSYALGLGPWFLLHAFQNVRTLVLHTSATFGREYDMAQIEWLSTSMSYLKVFQERAYRYKDNPYAFFYDLEQLIERPAINAAGAGNAALILTIDKLVDGIESVVSDIETVRDDVSKLVKQLPESIREHIDPLIDPIIKRFDTFKTEAYDPTITKFNLIFAEINSAQIRTKDKIGSLVNRLKRPGDYLSEIDTFSEFERQIQERQVADLASRGLTRDSVEVESYATETSAELERIRLALKYVTLEPLDMPVELEAPARPAGVPAKERESWNVGDY